MRILHVIDSLRMRRGGPPIVAASLAAAQAALGHEVHLLSYAHADAPAVEDSEPIAQQVPGFAAVHHVRLPIPSLGERIVARQARAALRGMTQRVEIGHLHRVWEGLIPAAARELGRAGIRYVLTPHGMLHPWALSQSSLRKRAAMALTHRKALRGAGALHALNADEQAHLEALKLGPPVRVVANGVWIPQTLAAPEPFRRRYAQLGEAPFVLFMGRLHYKKGPDILIDAFAQLHRRLPDLRLVIAGDDSGARADILQRIASAGLENHAILVGPIYGPQKQAALAEASCFCLPSRQEGFPIAVLEALAAGLPVVISPECYMPEVQREEAGLVVPLEAGAFADGLGRLLLDTALRARMSANARAMVERSYTWPKIAQQMLEVYCDLLAR